MNVAQLVEELRGMDPDLPVLVRTREYGGETGATGVTREAGGVTIAGAGWPEVLDAPGLTVEALVAALRGVSREAVARVTDAKGRAIEAAFVFAGEWGLRDDPQPCVRVEGDEPRADFLVDRAEPD